MLLLYVGLMWLITGDVMHPYYFFLKKWYFLALMFIGFGVQMYYFQRIRITVHRNSVAMAGASVGVSGMAMVACCAHHIVDVLPFVGLIGIAGSITLYQDWFLGFGVVMNVIGLIYMIRRLGRLQRMSCAV